MGRIAAINAAIVFGIGLFHGFKGGLCFHKCRSVKFLNNFFIIAITVQVTSVNDHFSTQPCAHFGVS